MALSNNPLVTAGGGGGSGKNVAGYVGEVNLFADGQLRPNHVWADGTAVPLGTYPELDEYAEENGWSKDEGGNYITPVITGFVSGWNSNATLYSQIRAKVDIIYMSQSSITSSTLSGFTNGDIYIQKNGKVSAISSDILASTEWKEGSYTVNPDLTSPVVHSCKVMYNKSLSLLYLNIDISFDAVSGPVTIVTLKDIPTIVNAIDISAAFGQFNAIYNAAISKLNPNGALSYTSDGTSMTRYFLTATISMANAGGGWPAIDEKKFLAVMSDGSGGGTDGVEIIWENTSPTSSFAAQTIACDSSKYNAIVVKCRMADGNVSTFAYMPTIDQYNNTMRIMSYIGENIVYRDVTYSETSLVFGNGYKISTLGPNLTPDIDNSFIPTTIYGIAGGAQASYCPYDVGDILETKNSTNPSQRWPGTEWVAIETFLLGASTAHTAGSTGGEETHTLTVEEMPAHNHDPIAFLNKPATTNITVQGGESYNVVASSPSVTANSLKTKEEGGNQPHNNMPPYTAVYIWERTA